MSPGVLLGSIRGPIGVSLVGSGMHRNPQAVRSMHLLES